MTLNANGDSTIDAPETTSYGNFYEANRQNPHRSEKLSAFSSDMARWFDKIDIALTKYCWIDIDEEQVSGNSELEKIANVRTEAETYCDHIKGLVEQYNEKVIIFTTVPIEKVSNDSNVLRFVFNEYVRDFCRTNNYYLLDIAAIESFNGTTKNIVSRTYGSTTYNIEVLAPGNAVSNDTGHLSTLGAERVAKALYSLAAKIAMGSNILIYNTTISSNAVTFPSLFQGYEKVTSFDINFENKSPVMADAFDFKIETDNFTIDKYSLLLSPESSGTLTITPVDGLVAGLYKDTLTIKRGSTIVKTIPITLRVHPTPNTVVYRNYLSTWAWVNYTKTKWTYLSLYNYNYVDDTLNYSIDDEENFTLWEKTNTVKARKYNYVYVKAKTGLAVGVHNVKLTISRGPTIVKEVDFTFTVYPNYNTSIDTNYLSFDTTVYRQTPISKTITITNNVDQLLNDKVSFSLRTRRFRLSAKSLTIAPQDSKTLTITPVSRLRAGTYKDTLTIKRGRSIIKRIPLRYTVKRTPKTYFANSEINFGEAPSHNPETLTKWLTFNNRAYYGDSLSFTLEDDTNFTLNTNALYIKARKKAYLGVTLKDNQEPGDYSTVLVVRRYGLEIARIVVKANVYPAN